jgi:hypothetical protein
MTQAAPGRPLGQTVEQVVGAAVMLACTCPRDRIEGLPAACRCWLVMASSGAPLAPPRARERLHVVAPLR